MVTEEPVEFTVPLEDTSATEGESVSLECVINRENVPSKWLKNGEEISPEDNCDIKTDGKRHICTIPEASVDDEGEYSVVIGDKSTSAKLNVEGRNHSVFGNNSFSLFVSC